MKSSLLVVVLCFGLTSNGQAQVSDTNKLKEVVVTGIKAVTDKYTFTVVNSDGLINNVSATLTGQ